MLTLLSCVSALDIYLQSPASGSFVMLMRTPFSGFVTGTLQGRVGVTQSVALASVFGIVRIGVCLNMTHSSF
jgi:hypothetical protein